MEYFFKITVLFLLPCLVLMGCSNKFLHTEENTGSLAIVVSWEIKPLERTRDIYLSGAWYYHDNTIFPDESTWMLSWNHYNYAISFHFLNKKNILKNCTDQLKNTEQWWGCYKNSDLKKLRTMFDLIDGENNQEKALIEGLSIQYTRIHNAKRIDAWKIIFTMGSSQDAGSMFPLYIAKIDQDRYIEVMAFPDMICEKDANCNTKIPILNRESGLDPFWNFIWSGVDSGSFVDPIIWETYDVMFDIEKNWQTITKNAIPW